LAAPTAPDGAGELSLDGPHPASTANPSNAIQPRIPLSITILFLRRVVPIDSAARGVVIG
jgi:hypothetical protein